MKGEPAEAVETVEFDTETPRRFAGATSVHDPRHEGFDV